MSLVKTPVVNSGSNRVRALDSARGLAMLLVCLSHFAEIYSKSSGASFDGVYFFTKMAAPTFMIVSGMLLGFFYVTKRNTFNLIKRDFINRGIFILVIARLFICLAFVLRANGFWESLKYVYITDVVGISIILGPILIEKIRPILRVLLGLFLIILAWIIIILWEPSNIYSGFFKEVFFGEWESAHFHVLHYVFPVLPWFSLYFIGSYFGERLGYSILEMDTSLIVKYFFKIGVYSIVVSSLVRLIFWLLKHYFSWPIFKSYSVWALTSPLYKTPPSIPYFLFYGGFSLIIISFLLYLENRKLLGYFRMAAVIGRNSLFVFVIQYYFYYTILYVLDLHYSQWWPIYFIISIIFILILTKIWDLGKLNRLLRLRIL